MKSGLTHILNALLAGAAMLAMCSSCDSMIYDDEGDCSVTYRVKFIDDMNLKFADAFDSEVTSVTLYVFSADDDSFIAMHSYADTDIATDNSVELTDLGPGRYRLVSWCGLGSGESFVTSTLTPQHSTTADLTCRMVRSGLTRDAADVVSSQLQPLFHGMTDIEIPTDATPGTHYYTVQLTKDTNNLHVVLQQLSGEDMNPADYEFTVENAANGLMAYDNSLLPDVSPVIYSASKISAGMAGVTADGSSTLSSEGGGTITSVQAVVSDLSMGRLVADSSTSKPQLVVRNVATGAVIISVPIIDYALLVRGHEPRITSDQEYLDRQDEYNMTFFLENGQWLANEIIINSWRIVLNQSDVEHDGD